MLIHLHFAGAVAYTTIRQLAHAFLNQDESQLLYYEKRIKEMPLSTETPSPATLPWVFVNLHNLEQSETPTQRQSS